MKIAAIQMVSSTSVTQNLRTARELVQQGRRAGDTLRHLVRPFSYAVR